MVILKAPLRWNTLDLASHNGAMVTAGATFPYFEATPGGAAAVFSGSQMLRYPDRPQYRVYDYTVSLWVRIDIDTGLTSDEHFIDSDQVSGTGMVLYRESANPLKVRFAHRKDVGYNLTSGDVLVKGEWAHICATRTTQGASGYAGIFLYINGILVGSDVNQPAYSNQLSAAYGFSIGNRPVEKTRSLHGAVRDVLIFNRCLNDSEVSQLYNGVYKDKSNV